MLTCTYVGYMRHTNECMYVAERPSVEYVCLKMCVALLLMAFVFPYGCDAVPLKNSKQNKKKKHSCKVQIWALTHICVCLCVCIVNIAYLKTVDASKNFIKFVHVHTYVQVCVFEYEYNSK